jgi:hypothetical protein
VKKMEGHYIFTYEEGINKPVKGERRKREWR